MSCRITSCAHVFMFVFIRGIPRGFINLMRRSHLKLVDSRGIPSVKLCFGEHSRGNYYDDS